MERPPPWWRMGEVYNKKSAREATSPSGQCLTARLPRHGPSIARNKLQSGYYNNLILQKVQKGNVTCPGSQS